jgi:hypothetical protein
LETKYDDYMSYRDFRNPTAAAAALGDAKMYIDDARAPHRRIAGKGQALESAAPRQASCTAPAANMKAKTPIACAAAPW